MLVSEAHEWTLSSCKLYLFWNLIYSRADSSGEYPGGTGESLTTLITKHVINMRYYVRYADCLVSAKSLSKIGHVAQVVLNIKKGQFKHVSSPVLVTYYTQNWTYSGSEGQNTPVQKII